MQIHKPTISDLILHLEAIRKQCGNLPICSEGHAPENTMIRTTTLRKDSTLARQPHQAEQLFIEMY